VDVRDERGAPEGAVLRLGLAEEAQTGAEVEDDRVLTGDLERDARGVPAVPAVGFARARGRAPDAVERDAQRDPPLSVSERYRCVFFG
jgi:hypothetical protein